VCVFVCVCVCVCVRVCVCVCVCVCVAFFVKAGKHAAVRGVRNAGIAHKAVQELTQYVVHKAVG